MSLVESIDEFGRAILRFSEDGTYPENEATSAATVDDAVLPAALEILQSARQDLESEIKTISQESAPDVDSWIVHAKMIQNDIQESKKLANNIARKAQEEDQRLEALQEQEAYAQFLQKELKFQDQLLESMNTIGHVHQMLNEVEDLACHFQIEEALQKLDIAEMARQQIPLNKDARATNILLITHMELEHLIRGQFMTAWNGLVRVKPDKGKISIYQKRPHVIMDMSTALKGLQRFEDVGEAARKLCDDIETILIGPRTDIHNLSPHSIKIDNQSMSLGDVTDSSLKSLFIDLEEVIRFLNMSLPKEIIPMVAAIMMRPLSQRLLDTWLYTAVPPNLDNMVDYQKALAVAHRFASCLDELKWSGADAFRDWVSSAPRIWLNKRREVELDWTRDQISLGIGKPYEVERIEKQMFDKTEAQELNGKTSGAPVNQEWDSAWGSDEDSTKEALTQDGERHRRSLEEERQSLSMVLPEELPSTDDEEDAADAWGWGDEEDTAVPVSQTPVNNQSAAAIPITSIATREVTLSEKYYISRIPQPLFNSVKKIYDDGARLTQPETEHVPISAAAPGLFSLPTLVLAMYRAISPSTYSNHPGGNMYLYNDGMWLSESFTKFTVEWNERTDLKPRAYGMVKLEPEIKALISFGKRAYTNELTEQRLLINDLFGGTQNFFQQDVAPGKHSLDEGINTVIRHVREQSKIWKDILPYSAWASAAGSLVNTIATRIINDVFELSDISVDDAERIATVILHVESMDDMFMKNSMPGAAKEGKDIAMTSRFADQWHKMVFLSEFLQSNLEQVKFLWLESELSLYFTVEEVMELIGLSFEKNVAVRGAMREIRNNPNPRG